MKVLGALRLAGQLFSANPNFRRQARYLIRAKIRGYDLNGADVESLGLDPDRSYCYSDSGWDLDPILRTLNISASEVALDLGCGKGGAMITLGKYFSRVDGVEISPQLAEVAEANLKRADLNSRVFCQDAAAFTDLDRYTTIYLFNPFPGPVLSVVLENLTASLARCPRQLRLIFRNPQDESIILKIGFRRVAAFEQKHLPIYIYSFGTVSPVEQNSSRLAG